MKIILVKNKRAQIRYSKEVYHTLREDKDSDMTCVPSGGKLSSHVENDSTARHGGS